jgi:hypothetical protein
LSLLFEIVNGAVEQLERMAQVGRKPSAGKSIVELGHAQAHRLSRFDGSPHQALERATLGGAQPSESKYIPLFTPLVAGTQSPAQLSKLGPTEQPLQSLESGNLLPHFKKSGSAA